LIFGPETRGLPAGVLDRIAADRRLSIPMRPGNRSINLSNTVALVVYEAWRQQGFAGASVAAGATHV
jgi:tRNA (cytidine/uridine-2'-O-)-methyltransferase